MSARHTSLWALAGLLLGGVCHGDVGDLGRAYIASYISEVDSSRQAYGVFVPSVGPPRSEGYPVVLHYHGYGWAVDDWFSEWQRRWAHAHGWILANVNGRGPTFYDGIGENDVFRVVQDIDRRYGVDETRIYATGGSMGGTGAYRQGVRWPEFFAGVVGVDGWTHFAEFHHHWYARQDARNAIEEFRRPLLEATSTVFAAPKAQTGNIGLVVDMLDDIVLPMNGQLLGDALGWLKVQSPTEFQHQYTEHADRGHGAGYDLEAIYRYFDDKQALVRPGAVRVATTQLKYGRAHWAQIERFVRPGVRADLEAVADGGLVTVQTDNVSRFTLDLFDSPAADEDLVRIVIDHNSAFELGPAALTFSFAPGATESGPRWRLGSEPAALAKTSALEGPIGHAFTQPFVLVVGGLGDAPATVRNRAEAQQFADDWNGMFVHYPAVRPIADLDVPPEQVVHRNLILFGTEDDNRLLRDAASLYDLPVRVFGDRIIVRDPVNGDREYPTRNFGVFFIHPNPLTAFRTYLVVSHGQFATGANGERPRGLGYDLEKLPWGWPDYVVFCKNQQMLPRVANSNNKEEAICYEAGYFVEAGCFDQEWQPQPGAELEWARQAQEARPALMRIKALWLRPVADNGRHAAEAKLIITDELGRPIPQARVCVRFEGAVEDVQAGVTDTDGAIVFRSPSTGLASGVIRCSVQSLMATGATHDAGADARRLSYVSFGQHSDVSVWVHSLPEPLAAGDVVRVVVAAQNLGTEDAECSVELRCRSGKANPATQRASLRPGETKLVTFWWDTQGLTTGEYALTARAALAQGHDAVVENNEDTQAAHLGHPIGQGG